MWSESIVSMSSMLETIFNSELCVVEEKGNANEWRTGERRSVTSHRHYQTLQLHRHKRTQN